MFKIKRFINTILLVLTCILIGFPNINPVLADAPDCTTGGVIKYTTTPSPPIPEDLKNLDIDFTGIAPGYYRLRMENGAIYPLFTSTITATKVNSDLKLHIAIVPTPDGTVLALNNGTHVATLIQYANPTDTSGTEYCGFIKYKIGYTDDECVMDIYPPNPREDEDLYVSVKNAPIGNWPLIINPPVVSGDTLLVMGVSSNGTGGWDFIPKFNRPYTGQLALFDPHFSLVGHNFCFASLIIQAAGGVPPRKGAPPAPGAPGAPGTPGTPGIPTPAFSGGIPCGNSPDHPGFTTAIGCIHTNPVEFAKDLLRFIIAIGGGLAFLMMLLGAFEMITSNGNPESLANGRSRLTSAVIGLLFIIFAVLLMQIIGANILNLPGFK